MKEQLLTVGMATYDDYTRTKFTVQNLMIQNEDIIKEVIVVNNNPKGKDTVKLEKWAKGSCRVRLINFDEVQGTAAPRNKVFEAATTPYVVCMDSHVLCPKGALVALMDYYAKNPDCMDLIQGPLVYDNLRTISTHFNDKWGGGMLGQWDTRQGWETFTHFDIPAQGLGLFACRKDGWLGFNPRFRGFGGEEWYIHEKYRKYGRKTICLTELQWWHDFGDDTAKPYPLSQKDKLRNYVIGFTELQDEKRLQQTKAHFNVTDQEWSKWLAVGRGEDEHVGSRAVSVTPTKVWPAEPDIIELVKAPDCKDPEKKCGQSTPLTVQKWFERSRDTKADLDQHANALVGLAKGKDVVELGARSGVSTAFLSYAKPKSLYTVGVSKNTIVAAMGNEIIKYGVPSFTYAVDSHTDKVGIPECDFLFIDSHHNGTHVYKELVAHAPKVRERIAFHDTKLYGDRGENGGEGLMSGILTFLKAHREWQVISHTDEQYGFTVISRLPEDRPPIEPGTLQKAWSFLKATFKQKFNGGTYLTLEDAKERIDTCLTCPTRSGEQCSKCSCYLFQMPDNVKVNAGQPGKVFYPLEMCPLGKWFTKPDAGVEMTPEQVEFTLTNMSGGVS
jgi:hypothetical protein